MRRLKYLKVVRHSTLDRTNYYKGQLPLRYISKFFEYYTQPLKNVNMEIYLEFKYNEGNGVVFPIQHANGVDDASVSVIADFSAGVNLIYQDYKSNP